MLALGRYLGKNQSPTSHSKIHACPTTIGLAGIAESAIGPEHTNQVTQATRPKWLLRDLHTWAPDVILSSATSHRDESKIPITTHKAMSTARSKRYLDSINPVPTPQGEYISTAPGQRSGNRNLIHNTALTKRA